MSRETNESLAIHASPGATPGRKTSRRARAVLLSLSIHLVVVLALTVVSSSGFHSPAGPPVRVALVPVAPSPEIPPPRTISRPSPVVRPDPVSSSPEAPRASESPASAIETPTESTRMMPPALGGSGESPAAIGISPSSGGSRVAVGASLPGIAEGSSFNESPAAPAYSASAPSWIAGYGAKIRSLVESKKTYPPIARRLRVTGDVTLSFVVARNGVIKSAKIARSSGRAILDKAALGTLYASAPLPPFPASAQAAEMEFTLALSYRLQ